MHPGLSEVRAAMEAQDDELAAVALRAKLAEAGAFEKDCPRCHYLLGVIEERRSATAQAIVAFENAAQSDWLLRKDALLHLVRLELQRSNCPRVKDLLDQVGVANGQGGTTATHAAQLEICLRNWQAATARLRQLVADDKSDTRRASHRLLLAETLTEQDQARSGDRRTGDDEVAKLLVEILSTEGAEPEILAKARAMLDRILLRNAKKSGVDQQLAERVALLEATVEARRWEEGRPLAEELTSLAWSEPNLKTLRCRVWLAHGRLAAAVGDRGAAIEKLNWVVDSCNDIDQAARALFLEAAQIASLGKRPEAIAKYAQLEQRFAAHRLADDARLKQANLYRAMEADSRFVALLDAMPNDYPNGDMVLEGLFQLALKDMQERNWSRALSVLERAERFARTLERPKDADVDRQKYFLGCINLVQGQRSAGIELLRELVSDRPLSYYMLLAYSVLARHAPDEARRVLEAVQSNTPPEPQRANSLSAEHQGQLERIVALLGVGDVAAADELMQEAGAQRFGDFATSSVAAMYADAGATKTALGLMKRMGRGWQAHWPTGGWSELWKVAYPRPYREMVQRESKRTGVDESLIYAIMREESEFDPKAVSQAEAFGLMQVILPTARSAARELGIKVDPRALKKPGVNIAVGSRVLSKLNERFSGQLALIAAGYNAGPGRPVRWLRKYPEMDLDLWIELIEYPETRGYVKRVLSSAAAYRWLYAASGGAEESILRLPARPGPGQ